MVNALFFDLVNEIIDNVQERPGKEVEKIGIFESSFENLMSELIKDTKILLELSFKGEKDMMYIKHDVLIKGEEYEVSLIGIQGLEKESKYLN